MGWSLASSNALAAGTWSVATAGSILNRSTARIAQLIPQNCVTGTFRVSTLGEPAAGQSHTFTLYRAPGPEPRDADLASTAFACTINSTARSCVTTGPAGFSAGDALELVWTNSAPLSTQAVSGAVAISFSCSD